MKRKISRATVVLGAALLIAPIVTMGGIATPSTAGAVTATNVLTCTGHRVAKPSTYLLSCADAGAEWTRVTWSKWTASTAVGHGILRQNNCIPNCAAGKFINYRAEVTLFNVQDTIGWNDLFTQAIFHYRVNGIAKSEVFGLMDS